MFAARIIWTLAEVGWGVYQARERMDWLAFSMGLRGLATIIPFARTSAAVLLAAAQRACDAGAAGRCTALAVVPPRAGVCGGLGAVRSAAGRDGQRVDLSTDRASVIALARQTVSAGGRPRW